MIAESLTLEKYFKIFKKDLREIIRAEVTFTLQLILETYEQGRYDVNQAVADLRVRLLSYVRSDSRQHERAVRLAKQLSGEENPTGEMPKSNSALSSSSSEEKKTTVARNKQFDEFFAELSMFFWNVSRSPGVWVLLLREDQITSATPLIDLYKFIKPVYNRLLVEGQKTCLIFQEVCSLVQPAVLRFLERTSVMIADEYNQNKRLIIELIDQMNTETKTMRLINKYMIYKLLRELSQSCYEEVRERLNDGVFRNVQPDILDRFTKFTIEKHEVVTFCNQQLVRDEPAAEQEGLEEQLQKKLLRKLTIEGKKVKVHNGTREDGQRGILIEVEKPDDAEHTVEESYVVKLSKDGSYLQVMNAASLQKKWSFGASGAATSPEDLISERKSMLDALKSAPTTAKKAAIESSIETVGGSLGSCLANIRNYDSIGGFVVDFSSKTLVSGSLSYLVERIPMIGYFLVAGGFTYSFYRVMKSKFKTTSKKIRDLGTMALDTGASIGAGIIGGIVGEVVIPVPFLGMFVGSVIGGFLGNLGKDVIVKHLESKRFEDMATYLDKHIQVEGYWQPTDDILDMLGVTRASFEKSVPGWLRQRENGSRLWMTVIGFCLLSYLESQKDRKKLQHEMEDDSKRPADKVAQDDPKQERIEQYISLNLEMAVHYLELQDMRLKWALPEIQSFIEKMFSG